MTGSRVCVAISSLLTTRSHRAPACASLPIIVDGNDGRQWHAASSRAMQDRGRRVDRKWHRWGGTEGLDILRPKKANLPNPREDIRSDLSYPRAPALYRLLRDPAHTCQWSLRVDAHR